MPEQTARLMTARLIEASRAGDGSLVDSGGGAGQKGSYLSKKAPRANARGVANLLVLLGCGLGREPPDLVLPRVRDVPELERVCEVADEAVAVARLDSVLDVVEVVVARRLEREGRPALLRAEREAGHVALARLAHVGGAVLELASGQGPSLGTVFHHDLLHLAHRPLLSFRHACCVPR